MVGKANVEKEKNEKQIKNKATGTKIIIGYHTKSSSLERLILYTGRVGVSSRFRCLGRAAGLGVCFLGSLFRGTDALAATGRRGTDALAATG